MDPDENMGTPLNPEHVQHFAAKSVVRMRIASALRMQEPFPITILECCGCGTYDIVENLLWDITDVQEELAVGPYRPDIVLLKDGQPMRAIEIVRTSPPSDDKVKYLLKRGIDIFLLSGGGRPEDARVIRSYISPSNCRRMHKDRVESLLRHLTELPADECKIGVQQDFRLPQTIQRERERSFNETQDRFQRLANGEFTCFRCGVLLTGEQLQSQWAHREDEGECGMVELCKPCMFEASMVPQGERDGVVVWGLGEDCEACAPKWAEAEKMVQRMPKDEPVVMHEEGYSRLVGPPTPQMQAYLVGNRSASAYELQSIICYFLRAMMLFDQRITPSARILMDIMKAIQFKNNDHTWNWRKAVGDSYIPEWREPSKETGNVYWYPKLMGWNPDGSTGSP